MSSLQVPVPDEGLSSAVVDAAVVRFRLLADPVRVRMLWRLCAGGVDVASLAALAGCSATAASQHLARLRLAGLVRGRRQGRRMVYEVSDPRVCGLLELVLADPGGYRPAGQG